MRLVWHRRWACLGSDMRRAVGVSSPPKDAASVRAFVPTATLFAHQANLAPKRIRSGHQRRRRRLAALRNQLLTRTLWEQQGSREASNLKSATCTDVFYANTRVHVSPGSYGITRRRWWRRRRDPSVIDSPHGTRGKREASDGNKPELLHDRVPFAAKLRGTITGFPDAVARKFKTVHKDRTA